MIYEREHVVRAVARALVLAPGDTESAIAVAAQALALPVEAVKEAVDSHPEAMRDEH